MTDKPVFHHEPLTEKGLNLHAIFNIKDLPGEFGDIQDSSFSQLIILGHGGKKMWSELNKANIESENPVDDFSIKVATDYFRAQLPIHKFKIIYPGEDVIGLRVLGELAGWHHDSPFRIGVNREWGSWFAYRVVVLADTDYLPSEKWRDNSPCDACSEKPCISACPVDALSSGSLSLEKCIQYRKVDASLCANTCHSRCACNVGVQHRYTDEQLHYHYSVSLRMIKQYY